jgi:peptide deformylase
LFQPNVSLADPILRQPAAALMMEIWLLGFVADWFANIPDASGIGLLDSVIDLHKRKEMI